MKDNRVFLSKDLLFMFFMSLLSGSAAFKIL